MIAAAPSPEVATSHCAEREALRARLFLRSMLPLLKVVVAEKESMAQLFRGVRATVQLQVEGAQLGAYFTLRDGELAVTQGISEHAEVRCTFKDVASLNRFFAGRAVLPRIAGLRHPVLIAKMVRLLSTLQILKPEAAPRQPAERALRVQLVLYLATHALCELHRGGHPEMRTLVERSPDRVYQWVIGDPAAGPGSVGASRCQAPLAAYLRMRYGQVKAGRGVYPHKRPFVQFLFPSVDAALSVFTAQSSQIDAVRRGDVQTIGCPEYTRKISILMQKVDELLMTD